MTLKELESELMALSPLENFELMSMLTKKLNNSVKGINKTPNVCGGDACIGNTRIPVWSLVNDKKLGMSDGEILAAFPQFSAIDLVNAWAYYAANSEEIEEAIRENNEIMESEEI